MPDRWEVSPDFPEGRWVPLTPEEIAQQEADRVAGEATALVDATAAANRRTVDQRLSDRLAAMQAARDAVTANPPTLFAGLTNQERVVIRNLILNDIGLIRLALSLLESPD